LGSSAERRGEKHGVPIQNVRENKSSECPTPANTQEPGNNVPIILDDTGIQLTENVLTYRVSIL
jgi:hypothetical protein